MDVGNRRRARRRNSGYDPDQDPEAELIEQGRAAAQRRYWRWVKSLREILNDDLRREIQEALDAGELDPSDLDEVYLQDRAWDMTHQLADDAMMYYPDCLEVLRFSDNAAAYDDTGSPPGPSEGATNLQWILCVYAQEAFALDLLEDVGANKDEFMKRGVKPSADISERKRRLLRL